MKENNNTEKNTRSFEKAKSIIIPIVMAIILWVAIINIVNPDVTTTVYNIPISINGTSNLRDKGLVLVNSDKLPTCSVTIRGKRNDIIESKERIFAVVNVSDIMTDGKVTVPVTITSPSSLNIEKQSISHIKANIESRREKVIPVSVKQENVPSDKLIKTVSEKQTIIISGAQKDLDKIDGCLVIPDLSGVTSDSTTLYSFVYTHNGEQIKKPYTVYSADSSILLTNTVYEKKSTKPILVIPENLNTLYKTDIKKTELNDKEVFYGVKSSSVLIPQIEYSFSVASISEGKNKIKLSANDIKDIYIPENQLTLEFNAEKILTKTVPVVIKPENLSSSLSVLSITPSEFLLTGTEKELKQAEATIDLTNISTGKHFLPIKFKNKNLQPAETCFVSVVIERKGE